MGNESGNPGTKSSSSSKGPVDNAADFIGSALRSTAKVWGQALKALGEGIEKLGEESKDAADK